LRASLLTPSAQNLVSLNSEGTITFANKVALGEERERKRKKGRAGKRGGGKAD
jgi:hypothetical protein